MDVVLVHPHDAVVERVGISDALDGAERLPREEEPHRGRRVIGDDRVEESARLVVHVAGARAGRGRRELGPIVRRDGGVLSDRQQRHERAGEGERTE